MIRRVGIVLVALALLGGAADAQTTGTAEPEARSLLGRPLYAPTPSPEAAREMEARLAKARADFEAAPEDPEAIIWLGRRTAYLGRYREAVEVYSRGIARHPRYAKLYRHRGHRHITLRQLDRAVADLELAAKLIAGVPDEVEPDGLPNARNIPTSTSHTNIWYHLGLAHYLRGDFERAVACYRECMKFSKNPDMTVATSYWLYLALRRVGHHREARAVLEPIREGMDIIENGDYYRLLLAFKSGKGVDEIFDEAKKGGGELSLPTIGYGVGAWHLVEGRRERATEIFTVVLDAPQWAAFGYIAAEAEMARARTRLVGARGLGATWRTVPPNSMSKGNPVKTW